MTKSPPKKEKRLPPLMQRGDFRRELRGMARRCIKELSWDPEADIAFIIEKYNLDMKKIKKKVDEYLRI